MTRQLKDKNAKFYYVKCDRRSKVNHTQLIIIVKKEKDKMNPSLTANTSFLHGSGKTALISDKVIYATLDSLALKQTRLPLRLLPVDCDNVTEKSDKEKTLVNGKTSPKRPPSCKVRSMNLEILCARKLSVDFLISFYNIANFIEQLNPNIQHMFLCILEKKT